MNNSALVNKTTRVFNKFIFGVKKHAPEVLVVAGVAGVVTSTVMACKASTKVNDIIEDTKTELDKIHTAGEKLKNGEELTLKDGSKYTIEDNKKDLTIIYTQTGLKFVKLYAPAVIVGALSLTAIIASHTLLRKRNVALAAAYATVDKGFKEYRSRVVERFGKELDRELKYNIKSKKIEETVTNEDGTETVVEKTVEVTDMKPTEYSEFARFFDEGCAGWTKDPEDNLRFLKLQQAWANERLERRGYLFLNEVYEALGIPKTKAGQVVGWIYDEKNPVGDNYVDFGIYDLYNERARAFVNGYERTILLDFNVDGNIAQKCFL